MRGHVGMCTCATECIGGQRSTRRTWFFPSTMTGSNSVCQDWHQGPLPTGPWSLAHLPGVFVCSGLGRSSTVICLRLCTRLRNLNFFLKLKFLVYLICILSMMQKLNFSSPESFQRCWLNDNTTSGLICLCPPILKPYMARFGLFGVDFYFLFFSPLISLSDVS